MEELQIPENRKELSIPVGLLIGGVFFFAIWISNNFQSWVSLTRTEKAYEKQSYTKIMNYEAVWFPFPIVEFIPTTTKTNATLQSKEKSCEPPNFTDTFDSPYKKHIDSFAQNCLVKWYSPTTFKPMGNLKKSDYVELLSKISEFKQWSTYQSFKTPEEQVEDLGLMSVFPSKTTTRSNDLLASEVIESLKLLSTQKTNRQTPVEIIHTGPIKKGELLFALDKFYSISDEYTKITNTQSNSCANNIDTLSNSPYWKAITSLSNLCILESTFEPNKIIDRKTFITRMVKTFDATRTKQFQTNLSAAPILKDITDPQLQLIVSKARMLGRLNTNSPNNPDTKSIIFKPDNPLKKDELAQILRNIPESNFDYLPQEVINWTYDMQITNEQAAYTIAKIFKLQ